MDEVVVMDGGVAIALLAIGNLLDGMEFLANDCKKVLFGYQSISSEADNEEETAGTTGTSATSCSSMRSRHRPRRADNTSQLQFAPGPRLSM